MADDLAARFYYIIAYALMRSLCMVVLHVLINNILQEAVYHHRLVELFLLFPPSWLHSQ